MFIVCMNDIRGDSFIRFEYGLGHILTTDHKLATRYTDKKEAIDIGLSLAKENQQGRFWLLDPYNLSVKLVVDIQKKRKKRSKDAD